MNCVRERVQVCKVCVCVCVLKVLPQILCNCASLCIFVTLNFIFKIFLIKYVKIKSLIFD